MGAIRKINEGEELFAFQCRAYKLPQPAAQYRIVSPQGRTPTGKPKTWIFDFAFLSHALLVEIDGGIWIQGAHAHPVDITRNMAKQNDAVLLGWAVLRFTPAQVKNGEAIAFVQRALTPNGSKGC